jgi:hypothetical protein
MAAPFPGAHLLRPKGAEEGGGLASGHAQTTSKSVVHTTLGAPTQQKVSGTVRSLLLDRGQMNLYLVYAIL